MSNIQYHKSIFANAPEAIYVLDSDGQLIDYNQTATRQIEMLLGQSLEQVENFFSLIPNKHRKNFIRNYRRALRGESLEFTRESTYQELRIFRVFYRPIPGKGNENIGVSVHVLDVTEERKKVERNQRRAELAVEGAKLGLWDQDMKTGTNIVNDYWYEMLGYTEEQFEATYEFFRQLLHPEDRAIIDELMFSYDWENESTFDLEIRMKDSDGIYRWIRDRGQVIKWDDEGNPLRLVGTHLYIDDRKRSEQKIRLLLEKVKKRERQLAESQRLAKVGSWEADLQTGEITWSDENFRIYGMDPEVGQEPAMQEAMEMFHPEDRPKVQQVLEQGMRLEGGEHTSFELDCRLIDANGELKYVNIRASFKKDEESGHIMGIGTTMDITERKSVEMDLQYTNSTIRALIESAPVAIYTIDSGGTVTDFWNEAAEEIFGWEREEVIGSPIPHIPEKEESVLHEIMEQLAEGQPVKRGPLVRQRKDGSNVYISLHAGPILDQQGELQQVLVIIEDITRQVQQHQELEKSLKEKEVLLSEVHHRVKNNLAIITSLLQMQGFKREDETIQQALRESQNRIQSIAMVHELLYNTENFAEISIEKYLDKFLSQLTDMVAADCAIDIQKEIQVQAINLNEAIPMGLILNEVVTNSLKHAFGEHEQGTIQIKVQRDSHGKICLCYRDDGPGLPDTISLEDHEGLGLTIIRTLLKQLGADYRVSSEDGFYLEFSFFESQTGDISSP